MNTFIAPLYEGTFSVGTDKKFHPIDRHDKPAKGALKISINPFLIHTPDRNYLFDTGLGEFGIETGCETICHNLADHGLSEYDITDIFASHLHYDHLGGLAHRQHGYWELTFPDAKLWVSRKGWEKVTAQEQYYDEEKTEFIHFLEAKADLHFIDTPAQPYPDIRVEHVGGHTGHHQVLYFESDEVKALMAGDIIGTGGAVNRKYAAKYDYEPKQSMKARAELAEFAHKNDYVIMCYHDNFRPLVKLTDYDERKGYTIQEYQSNVAT